MSTNFHWTFCRRVIRNRSNLSWLWSDIFSSSSRPCSLVAASRPASSRPAVDSFEGKPVLPKFRRGKDLRSTGNPNKFGNLSTELKLEDKLDSLPEEEGDVVRKNYVEGRVGKTRLSTKQYADIIKKHLDDNKLLEALDVLEVRMLKEDRVKPENYIFNLLITGCAKFGYTKKAFQLYNQMKKRDVKVTGATYTSLFNACALCPVPGDGLKRAHHLRELIIEKQVLLNRSNYHSMMKAFGRCGDLVTVFSIVDEMVTNGTPLTPDTFCFLLQACASDTHNGFRHALLVWNKMREKRVKPSLYCYNLMLRCVRDCDLGDQQLLAQDIDYITSGSRKADEKKLLGRGVSQQDLPTLIGTLPDLLGVTPRMGGVVSINNISKPKHRLMLLGGQKGVLSVMKSDGVVADIKTATLLLDIVPSTRIAELELMAAMKESNISFDIDFCNMLIKKRNMRNDYSAAKEVLNLITDNRLLPNLMTFGVLSLSCRNTKDTKQFLQDLNSAGFRPNMEILGGLVCAARHSWNCDMVMYMMDIVLKHEMKVSKLFISHLDRFKQFNQTQIQLKNEDLPYHEKVDNHLYVESFEKFLVKYNMWSKLIEMETRDSIHPWAQFTRKTPRASNTQPPDNNS